MDNLLNVIARERGMIRRTLLFILITLSISEQTYQASDDYSTESSHQEYFSQDLEFTMGDASKEFQSEPFDFQNARIVNKDKFETFSQDTHKEKKAEKRNLQDQDTGCPESEPYVAFAVDDAGSQSKIEIADIEVRPSDRMQYVTGTFTDYDGGFTGGKQDFCFLARITPRGDFQDSMYFKTLSHADLRDDSYKCQALALIQKVDNIVVVGSWTGNTHPYVNDVYNYNLQKSRAIIFLTTSDLKLIGVKYWFQADPYSSSPQVIGYDVAVSEGDGSIYITGSHSFGHTRKSDASQDCFVLKLDGQLNRIFSKSFGFLATDTFQSIYCTHIQLTRNADYIFLAGSVDNKNIFFGKTSATLDKMVFTTLTPNAVAEVPTLRRIMIEANVTLASQPKLYFCGQTPNNQGDMIFGIVQSTDVTSIAIQVIFQYGSPDVEQVGDCRLTDDNKYFVGVLSTNHQPTFASAFPPGSAGLTLGPGFQTSPLFDNSCDPQSNFNGMLTWTMRNDVRNFCSANMNAANFIAGLKAYEANYQDNIYSWRTCDYYAYRFSQQRCYVSNVILDSSDCPATMPSGCTNDCTGAATLAHFINGLNDILDWYVNTQPNSYCAQFEFQHQVMNALFYDSSYAAGWQSTPALGGYFRQYMFCQKDFYSSGGTTVNCANANAPNMQVDFIFDQDCSQDANRYFSWLVFKVPVADLVAAKVDQIPELAVTFGDKDGDLKAQALTVDQYGYIYIQGVAATNTFGGSMSTPSWIHAKTHWEMTYELQCNRVSGVNSAGQCQEYQESQKLGKRFTIPKKFKNNDFSPTQPSHFMKVYYPSTPAHTIGTFAPQKATEINEPTRSISQLEAVATNSFKVDYLKSIYKFGVSYTRMNMMGDINFFRPNVLTSNTIKYQYSIAVPSACLGLEKTFPQNDWWQQRKILYREKDVEIRDAPTVSGLTMKVSVAALPNPTDLTYLHIEQDFSVSPALATERIETFTLRVTQKSQHIDQAAGRFTCDYPNYGQFWNDKDFRQLRRFEVSQRVKIIYDLESELAPYLIADIRDKYPVVNQLVQSEKIDQYFSKCSMYYVRLSRQELTGVQTQFSHHTLPGWVNFYESNFTFVMQPPSTVNKISVEVQCCNDINQCATSEFNIIPKTSQPQNLIQGLEKLHVIQYDKDPLSTMGQGFQWALKQVYFYDTDRDPDYQPYSRTDHRAWIQFTNADPTSTLKYRQVPNVGSVFWQGFPHNLGMNQITYRIWDLDVSTGEDSYFQLYINQMPYRTAVGRQAKLPDVVDPCKEYKTSYFDQFIPASRIDDEPEKFQVDVSSWFKQDDNDRLLYQMTMSDRTPAPGWMKFHREQAYLDGNATRQDGSQLLQLRFSVQDTMHGEQALYKTLLVNCAPKPSVTIKNLIFGINRKVYFNLSHLINDEDGDKLNFTLVNPDHYQILERHGLHFQWVNRALVGRPEFTGNLPLMKVRAADAHGFFTEVFLGIVIDDFKPKRRSKFNEEIFADEFSIIEWTDFDFVLPDDIFFDQQGMQPLVLFASDLTDAKLPDWITFDPKTRHFHGFAPRSPRELKIRIHAMNQHTHDSMSFVFSLRVTRNTPPKTWKQSFTHDVTATDKGVWFEYTLPIDAFYDDMDNKHHALLSQRSDAMHMPSFIRFNTDNRTLYGLLLPRHLIDNIYRFDFIFIDDQGQRAFTNVKLTILRPLPLEPYFHYPLYLCSLTAFLGLLGYFLHLFLMVHLLHLRFQLRPLWLWPYWLNALSRFYLFKDFKVSYRCGTRKGRQYDTYQRSQVAKRVLGGRGGIRVEASKNRPAWMHGEKDRLKTLWETNTEGPLSSQGDDESRIQKYIKRNLSRTVAIRVMNR